MANLAFDVVIVGGGNAALCGALAAAEKGAKVALIERAPEEKRGGNSRFTGGGFRMVQDSFTAEKTKVWKNNNLAHPENKTTPSAFTIASGCCICTSHHVNQLTSRATAAPAR